MANYHGEISTYALNLYSNKRGARYKHLIYLRGTFGLAFLAFVPDGDPIPAGGKRGGSDVFDVFFPMSDWAPIVDALRNEKPIHFWYLESSDTGGVRTQAEPVGENEPA